MVNDEDEAVLRVVISWDSFFLAWPPACSEKQNLASVTPTSRQQGWNTNKRDRTTTRGNYTECV
jgi:hypothetical protein